VTEWRIVSDRQYQGTETSTAEASRRARPADTDSALLVLAEQFDSLVTELAAAQGLSKELTIDAVQQGPQSGTDTGEECDTGTSQIEAVLTRLYPIELKILATPARTITDLGVKARHAAYVMSRYWDAPINKLDWDARTVRLLIEAVCDFAGTTCPLKSREMKADFSRPSPSATADPFGLQQIIKL